MTTTASVSSSDRPAKIEGVLHYRVGEEEKSVEYSVDVPCSAFIGPKALGAVSLRSFGADVVLACQWRVAHGLLLCLADLQDEFTNMLQDGGLCPAMNLVLSRQGASFDAAVAGVCHTLHLCGKPFWSGGRLRCCSFLPDGRFFFSSFTVIEAMSGAVSLYGATVDEKSIAVLCKQTVS